MPKVNAPGFLARADAARAVGDIETMRAALVAAFDEARSAGDHQAMAAAALAMPASQRFGVYPGQLPALLHEAYQVAEAPQTRCRLAAALARSWVYGGDATRAARFADEAQRVAAEVGTAEAAADALDAALLAHWGPDDFSERISLAARLDDVAAHLTDPEARLSAHLWRLTTAWECLDIVAVQRQLRALEVVAEETGSARAAFFAASRRAMHALAISDLTEAGPLISLTEAIGGKVAEPDVEAVVHSLHAMRALVAGDLTALRAEAADFEAFGTAEGIPSVCAEAAMWWLAAGQPDRAERLVNQLMAGGVARVARDVDFLLHVTCSVMVAAALGLSDICREAAEALEPYAGRGVLNAGAVTFHGVVDEYLYLAHRALGDDDAEGWRHAAESAYRRIGATWWEQRVGGKGAAGTPPHPERRVHLRPDGAGRWLIGVEGATFELADLKGLSYLRCLVERPGAEVDARVLSGAPSGLAGAVVDEGDMGVVLDTAALAAYRHRLGELGTQLDAADRRGDRLQATALTVERDALLAQLRAATGLGGRQRRMGGSAERARVAVRKAIAAALAQIDRHDPGVARLLRDSVRTGMSCRYDPNPEYPVNWITQLAIAVSRLDTSPGSGRRGRSSSVLGEQAVLHGEHRGGGPAGGPDLGVDVLDMVARRLRRDHQPFGDPPVR
jgi:hypothetical protein